MAEELVIKISAEIDEASFEAAKSRIEELESSARINILDPNYDELKSENSILKKRIEILQKHIPEDEWVSSDADPLQDIMKTQGEMNKPMSLEVKPIEEIEPDPDLVCRW